MKTFWTLWTPAGIAVSVPEGGILGPRINRDRAKLNDLIVISADSIQMYLREIGALAFVG
jgi:hypothetical protein